MYQQNAIRLTLNKETSHLGILTIKISEKKVIFKKIY